MDRLCAGTGPGVRNCNCECCKSLLSPEWSCLHEFIRLQMNSFRKLLYEMFKISCLWNASVCTWSVHGMIINFTKTTRCERISNIMLVFFTYKALWIFYRWKQFICNEKQLFSSYSVLRSFLHIIKHAMKMFWRVVIQIESVATSNYTSL